MLAILLLIATAVHGRIPAADGSISYIVEHSLSGGPFTPRGTVELQYTSGSKIGSVSFTNSQLSNDDISALQALSKTNGYYRIRIPLDNDRFLLSSVPACAFVTSKLKEYVTFHADVYGNLIGMDYETYTFDCEDKLLALDAKISSRGRILLGRAGEKPRDIRSTEIPKVAAADAPPPQPGFLQRYWMPLLILFLVMRFSGGGEGGQAAAPSQ